VQKILSEFQIFKFNVPLGCKLSIHQSASVSHHIIYTTTNTAYVYNVCVYMYCAVLKEEREREKK
jgi:hypothetical protein